MIKNNHKFAMSEINSWIMINLQLIICCDDKIKILQLCYIIVFDDNNSI